MTRKKVTLQDIADHCGLAATTVSRILRNKSTYCSAAKIEMVKRIAAEWDYRLNIGYNIMTGRNTNIAAILFSQFRSIQDDQTNRLYMQLSCGLDARNFSSYTAVMDGDMDSQLRKIRDLDERGCRYYIFLGAPAHYEVVFAFLDRMKRNYVGFDNYLVPRRVMPDRAGAYVQYYKSLLKENIQNYRIAVTEHYFNTRILPLIPDAEKERFKCCLLAVPPMRLANGSSSEFYFDLGADIMRRVLEKYPETKALAFTTDYHVFGAARVLQERGLCGKIRLFGMRDATASQFVQIPFTTTRFDVESGADILLDRIAEPGEWEVTLPGKLINYN